MVASLVRRAPLLARSVLGAGALLACTGPVAHQDLASLLLQQPGVAERARTFLLANSFSTLKTATFSFPSPLGGAIPQLPIPDHFEVLTGSIARAARTERAPRATTELAVLEPDVQTMNRSRKSDPWRMSAAAAARMTEILAASPSPAESSVRPDPGIDVVEMDLGLSAERFDIAGTIARSYDPFPPAGTLVRSPRVLFDADDPGLPPVAFEHQPLSPVANLMLAALPGEPALSAEPGESGTSVARKGLVTGDGAQPRSPAERLALSGAKRARAEKCLADAIYFESRGEIERGQIAVAQVVINRVFSGHYPEDVCGTVYQNAHRYLACQFTFACEGRKLVVNDQAAWERATRISRDMLDGKLWLPDVGKATHYHAYWVSPWWTRDMRRIQRIGVHTFYRPRKWEAEDGG